MRVEEKIKDAMNRHSRNFKNVSEKNVKRQIIYSIIFGMISCLIFRFFMNSINPTYHDFIIALISLIGGFIISYSLTPKNLWSVFSLIVSAILIFLSFNITSNLLFARFLVQSF